MTSSRRRLIGVLALLGAFALGPALGAAQTSPGPDEMSLGDPKAKVTVIEYASASCPHCAHFNNEIFPAFKARFIDTGQVRYVFREFLTPPIEVAAASFLLARCAGRDKYFSVLDTLFRGQQQMYETGDVGGALVRAGQGAGMTQAQVEACLADRAAAEALNARVDRYEQQDGVHSTPTFVINGRMLDPETAPTLANLDAAIAAARAAR
jgi:protein-disulfide isomerase